MVSGIGADDKICREQINHVPDGHKIQNPVLIRFHFGTVRRILIYDIVDFFIKESFLVLFHAVFEKVITIVLCHGRKFLAYQADVLPFPVRSGDTIKENGEEFLEDDIHAVIFFSLTVYKCESLFTCIIWIKVKILVCLVGNIGKEFLLHSLQSGHKNRNSGNISGICISNQNKNIPVQALPFNRAKVQGNGYSLKISVGFYAFGGEIISYGIFGKFASEKKSGFYIFVPAFFKVERYPENSMAHLKTVVGTGQKIFHKICPAA